MSRLTFLSLLLITFVIFLLQYFIGSVFPTDIFFNRLEIYLESHSAVVSYDRTLTIGGSITVQLVPVFQVKIQLLFYIQKTTYSLPW